MLKRLSHDTDDRNLSVPVAEAEYPRPFYWGLEFYPPTHGTWNIVHIGMLVPEAHQIYVCADNCMRGVIMTAVEMGLEDRFSCVTITEQDFYRDNLEGITLEGVSSVLRGMEKLPPVVMLFTVCVHKFVGCDLDYVYRELDRRFPEVVFLRCYMDPISQKAAPSPESKLRLVMFDPIKVRMPNPETVNILGCDIALQKDSDLIRIASEQGIQVRQLQDCKTYAEYLELGSSALHICNYFIGKEAVERLAERTGRPMLYLPPEVAYDRISEDWARFCGVLQIPCPDPTGEIEQCEAAFSRLRKEIGDCPVAIDYTAHPRPLGLARQLLEHGIKVETVCLDSILQEDEQDFRYLQKHFPTLRLAATISPKRRLAYGGGRECLAIGQRAAWLYQTKHFVNMIEGGGLWGFAGLRTLTEWMIAAFREEKELQELVSKKGLCGPCVI